MHAKLTGIKQAITKRLARLSRRGREQWLAQMLGDERPLSEQDYALINAQDYGFMSDRSEAILLRSPQGARQLIVIVLVFVVVFIMWANWAEIDEVTVGQGKAVPAQQLQVSQNMEGGIISEVLVKAGDTVEKGQVLLKIDDTQFAASLEEINKKLQVLTVRKYRLLAEIEEKPLDFPEDLEQDFTEVVKQERNLYVARHQELEATLSAFESQIKQIKQRAIEINSRKEFLEKSVALSQKELAMTAPLVAKGAISEVEVIRLEKSVNDVLGELASVKLEIPRLAMEVEELEGKRDERKLQFRNESREQLNALLADYTTISETTVAAKDRVKRTAVRSPVRGVVQRVLANTITSVVRPGMDLIEIVPLDESLVVEAKIKPTDIAFIRPDQDVVVKFTAYDFTIYGGLKAKLEHISPDAVIEEDESFYLVKVRTDKNHLGTEQAPLAIIPGMVATVDIITGKKTIMDYLLKPVLRAKQQALRER
jgi:adhesin transport system membrane fusion protein